MIELRNAYGLVYVNPGRIISIMPADVRQSKADNSRLGDGSQIALEGASDVFVVETPLEVSELLL